jgi:hypothetical protein
MAANRVFTSQFRPGFEYKQLAEFRNLKALNSPADFIPGI